MDPEAEVQRLGLVDMSEVVFNRRLRRGGFGGMGKGGGLPGTGVDVLELWQDRLVGVRGTVVTGVRSLGTLMVAVVVRRTLLSSRN